MLTVPYRASHFDRKWGKALRTGKHYVQVTWEELVWSAITVGKPGVSHLLSHGWHSVSDWIVRSHTVYANLQESPRRVIKSDLYESLDPTEKGATSYFMGMMAAKIVGARLLDTPWLFHLSMLGGLGHTVSLLGKSQPDLIGLNRVGDWVVVEAKGRTNGFSNDAMIAAKEQTRQLAHVNGVLPVLRVAVQAFFSPGLTVAIRDPEDFREGAVDLQFDVEDALKRYYELAEAVTRNTSDIRKIRGREFSFRTLDDVGVSIGFERGTAEALGEVASPQEMAKALEEVSPGQDEAQSASVFADGIAIVLDERWSSDRMQRDPRARRT